MAIEFTPERWERVRDTHRRWWAGELERPVVPVELSGRDPGRPPRDPAREDDVRHQLHIYGID